jgi:hypothetical protein
MSELVAVTEGKLFYAGISFLLAILSKIVWDYTKGGRVEKAAIYMTPIACQTVQKNCNIGELKKQVSAIYTDLEIFKVETRTHQQETEKRFNEAFSSIQAICSDVTSIKEAMVEHSVMLKLLVDSVKGGNRI